MVSRPERRQLIFHELYAGQECVHLSGQKRYALPVEGTSSEKSRTTYDHSILGQTYIPGDPGQPVYQSVNRKPTFARRFTEQRPDQWPGWHSVCYDEKRQILFKEIGE
jgi:hypothetical protein